MPECLHCSAEKLNGLQMQRFDPGMLHLYTFASFTVMHWFQAVLAWFHGHAWQFKALQDSVSNVWVLYSLSTIVTHVGPVKGQVSKDEARKNSLPCAGQGILA